MQFMTVFTYEPAHRDEVIKRRLELGPTLPSGMKRLNEWSYLGSGKVFTLIEVNDPAATLEATRMWSDLGRFEIYPVMDTDKVLQTYAAHVMTTSAR